MPYLNSMDNMIIHLSFFHYHLTIHIKYADRPENLLPVIGYKCEQVIQDSEIFLTVYCLPADLYHS